MSNEGTLHPHSRKELKAKSAKKNYVYNVLYQVLLLIVPLITTPYISRVLGPEGVGQYSYTYSLITYFTLAAALGFGYYAQREIASNREDAYTRSKLFWEILLCRLLPTCICLAVNFTLCVTRVYGDDSTLMLVMSCSIAAIAIDASFYCQGMEDFGKIVLRNTIVKIATVAMIFIFVNSSDDVWLYALINLGMSIVGNATLWVGLPGYLVRVKAKDLHPFRHLPGTLRLFLPTIVISIYTVLDKTLIGIITQSDAENGFYEQADKVVKIALTVVTCLGTVMIPRNTAEFKRGNIDKLRSNIYFASKFVWFLGTALVFGISAVTFNFNGWFFGEGYESVNRIMIVLSGLCLAIGMSNVLGVQYLVPTGRDKTFTLTVTAGAIVNTVLNIPLIIFFGAFGAAIATIIAECSVTGVQLFCVRKELKASKILLGGIKNIIAGAIMFAAIFPMSWFLPSNIGFTVLIVLAGAAIYFLALFILRDKFFLDNTKAVFGKVKNILKKRKPSAPVAVHDAVPSASPVSALVEVSVASPKPTRAVVSDMPARHDEGGYSGKYSSVRYAGRYARRSYMGNFSHLHK